MYVIYGVCQRHRRPAVLRQWRVSFSTLDAVRDYIQHVDFTQIVEENFYCTYTLANSHLIRGQGFASFDELFDFVSQLDGHLLEVRDAL